MKKKIWILEDSESEIEIYRYILSDAYELRLFDSLDPFKQAWMASSVAESPQLVIADLRLKGNDDFAVFLQDEKDRQLMRSPFIVTSSIDDYGTMEHCFSAGASDYLVKPFSKNALLVKVNRAIDQRPSLSNFSEFGDDLRYTLKERLILEEFLKSSGRRVNRRQLVERVWPGVKVESKTLDVHLCNLRRKMAQIHYSIDLVGHQEWVLAKLEASKTATHAVPSSSLVAPGDLSLVGGNSRGEMPMEFSSI